MQKKYLLIGLCLVSLWLCQALAWNDPDNLFHLIGLSPDGQYVAYESYSNSVSDTCEIRFWDALKSAEIKGVNYTNDESGKFSDVETMQRTRHKCYELAAKKITELKILAGSSVLPLGNGDEFYLRPSDVTYKAKLMIETRKTKPKITEDDPWGARVSEANLNFEITKDKKVVTSSKFQVVLPKTHSPISSLQVRQVYGYGLPDYRIRLVVVIKRTLYGTEGGHTDYFVSTFSIKVPDAIGK